jgi:hypothetical protein
LSWIVVGFITGFARAHSQLSAAEQAPAVKKNADPIFKVPYVNADEWRDKPVRHRYVHGGFKGTEARFRSISPKEE